jgi:transposase-like protein
MRLDAVACVKYLITMTNERRRSQRGIKPATGRSDIVAEIPAACSDELKAVEFFERQRWDGSVGCPRCGDTDVYQLKNAKTGERHTRFLWACRGCKQQFTVRIGTILEDSRVPLRHWAYAFWAACSSKKGVSALQIRRMTGLSYKSALFLMHRIRFAMTPTPSGPQPLTGTVEIDETYVGGKPRKGSAEMERRLGGRLKARRGPARDFADRKTPVVAMLQRGGSVRAMVMPTVSVNNLKEALTANVDPSARVMTDERPGYRKIVPAHTGQHETVNHSKGEYARGDVTTNGVEGFFSRLKRQMYGTHHAVSRAHLHRYVAEVAFKHNTRSMDDGERTAEAINGGEGKRLRYKAPVGR